jgi:acyl-CoA hydrolase
VERRAFEQAHDGEPGADHGAAHAERVDGAWARVTEAQLTMVSVDAQGKSIPFREHGQSEHAEKPA